MMDNDKLKHLEFIQDAIKRMASNSFLLKGWSITLVSALFVLAEKNENPNFFWISFIPILCFWMLDGYYLSLERKFRALYKDTIINGSQVSSMSLDINTYSGWKWKYWKTWWIIGILRPATSFFYLGLIVGMLLIIYSFHGGCHVAQCIF